MKGVVPISLAAASCLATANAIDLHKRTDGEAPRVVHFNIQRHDITDHVEHDQARLQRRAGTVGAALGNLKALYTMEGQLGTPPQSMKLHIDTGSSDLWVNVANSNFCANQANNCDTYGTYDANASSTYSFINSEFRIVYDDMSGASGDYALDNFMFAGGSLPEQEFGIGYVSSDSQGVLGIGYKTNEAILQYDGDVPYANVPQGLVTLGNISSNAYSLWLDDYASKTGSILFGGVNSAKYTGTLSTLPIIPVNGVYSEFIIALTAIGANGTSGSYANNIANPALLDSGTSLTYIPNSIAQDIYDTVGARYNYDTKYAYVPCSLAESSMTIDFTFSGPTIRVALNQLVVVQSTSATGAQTCILGIGFANNQMSILGDTFLRSAYVVYDLHNNEISLAQTNPNPPADDIQEITPSTVPGASAVANAVTDVQVPTGTTGIAPVTITSGGAAPALTPPPLFNQLAVLGAAAGAGLAWAM